MRDLVARPPDDILPVPKTAHRAVRLPDDLIRPDDDQHVLQSINDGLQLVAGVLLVCWFCHPPLPGVEFIGFGEVCQAQFVAAAAGGYSLLAEVIVV